MNAPRPTRRLGLALPLLLVVAALAVAGIVSRRSAWPPWRMMSTAPKSSPAGVALAAIPADDSGTFQVTAATGVVEAERDGRWIPIKNGDTLTRADVVRTAAGARAVLQLSAGTEIELRERVEIGLDRLPSGPTLDLRRGKVLARVTGADALAITSHQTRTANEGPARFVVLSDPQGRVSVATLSGTARFAAGGKAVAVSAGTQSSSQAGAAPADPERIPEEIFLEVVWPAGEQRHATEHTDLRGRAAPFSAVTVNGTPATVGTDGQFQAALPLHEGKNPIAVEVEDLSGRTRQASTTVVRRGPPAPALTPEARELWKP
jgi:Glucodextranase, domain B/FecR protein